MPFDIERPAPVGGVKVRTDSGYIIAGPDENGCCVIHELWVHGPGRRNGTGRWLVGMVRRWAAERGYAPLLVHCSPGNEAGRKFYEALGMRPVAVVYQDDMRGEGEGE